MKCHTLWTRRYERDTLGQIRERADRLQGLRHYGYDSLGRLVRAEDGGNDVLSGYFSYDAASQRSYVAGHFGVPWVQLRQSQFPVGCKYSIDLKLSGLQIIVIQDTPQPLTAANNVFA